MTADQARDLTPAAGISKAGVGVRLAGLAAGIGLTLHPGATPGLALTGGLALALVLGNPWARWSARASGLLLQGAVVCLGFAIPLERLAALGAMGLAITAFTIAATFALGRWIASRLAVESSVATLITAGTSICGGSAIAAMGPAIGAGREAIGMSLATVFLLNAVALYLFPPIGHALGLSQHQFGIWAALAIHDTSSVVGAAATFGAAALQEATVLKLSRALWILPLVLVAAACRRGARHAGRLPVPWFIGGFVLAAMTRSLAGAGALPLLDQVARGGRVALTTTLFLIGASLTRSQVRDVGARPMLMGVILWAAVTAATLLGVLVLA